MPSHDSATEIPTESSPKLAGSNAGMRSTWRKLSYSALNVLSVALVALLCVDAFSAFNHNDFMYAVAPTLLGKHTLYDELGFVQAPGSIWLFNLIFQFVGPADFYVFVRAFSLFLLISAGFLIFQTARVVAGRPASYLVPAILCASPIVLSVAEEIGNTSLALFFLSAAVFVYFTKQPTIISSAIIGLLIGLSAATKLNFALYAFPFGILLAIDRGLLSRHIISYCVAGLVGFAPVLYYLITAPEQFWFFNIDFHYLTNLWRGEGATTGVAAAGALILTFVWMSLPQLSLFILAYTPSRRIHRASKISSSILILAISLVAAVTPLFYALQYLAASAFVLAFTTAVAARAVAGRFSSGSFRYWIVVFSIALLVVVSNGLTQTKKSLNEYRENSVAPLAMLGISERIEEIFDQYLNGTTCSKLTLSLSPIPFIGTSFSISAFGATGPFLPRIAQQIAQHAPDFSQYADIGNTIQQTAPTAFLVGFYPNSPIEKDIRSYASQAGFKAFPIGSMRQQGNRGPVRNLSLLIRKSCTNAS